MHLFKKKIWEILITNFSCYLQMSSVRSLWELGLCASTFEGSWISKQLINGSIDVCWFHISAIFNSRVSFLDPIIFIIFPGRRFLGQISKLCTGSRQIWICSDIWPHRQISWSVEKIQEWLHQRTGSRTSPFWACFSPYQVSWWRFQWVGPPKKELDWHRFYLWPSQ